MERLRYFIDTHDTRSGSLPAGLTAESFELFFAQYEAACAAEGVVPVRSHLGLADGRAFCLNLAPDAEAVRRAHARVGLPFDSITEVQLASPADLFFRRPAATG